MLEDLWNGILDLTAKLVIPDWGALIALIPIGLLVAVVLWLLLLVRKFATAGPTRRGKRRITPVPPPHVHMPGGSIAPFIVAAGAAALFFGLVIGGAAIWIGAGILTLALLVWGAEGLRDYDHLVASDAPQLPATIHAGPPPGVHMPGPSFRPIVGALGVAVLFFGLVFGGWLLLVGVIVLIATLVGWLVDARKEYVNTVRADATGHLENIPAPSWPGRLLSVGALLVALALLVDTGILPPRTDSASGGGPGESPAPGVSGPPGSGEPQPSGPGGDVAIAALNIQFTTTEVTATGPDFTIAFDNQDAGAPHDVDILGGDGKLFDGEIITGPRVITYDVTGIEPGSYEFICSVHANMKGTITVQ